MSLACLFTVFSLMDQLPVGNWIVICPYLLKTDWLTCVAMEYSSMRGSLVKWNCSGSSVDSDTCRPRARYSGSGDLADKVEEVYIITVLSQTTWPKREKNA